MKRLLFFILTLLCSASLIASPKFEAGKRYHIVCQQFTQGCVTDGGTARANTPLHYLTQRTTNDETYWVFTREHGDVYSIKNAKTGKYITYDGIRQDSPQLRRYVSMTDEKDANNSLWVVSQQEQGVYIIRNMNHSDQLWDVRVDSYCVGTYSNSGNGNRNQQFYFLDESGNRVTERPANDTGNGYDVTPWIDATAESSDGWTFEGDTWGDPGFGYYTNETAAVISPFLERWHSQYEGGLSDGALKRTIQNLPAGKYTLNADVIAVLQGWNASDFGTPATGVYLFANDQRTSCSTGSERPQTYSVSITVGNEGSLTLGLSLEGTTANWVACDNFQLVFDGTMEEMLEGEKEKIRKELSDYFNDSEIAARIAAAGDDYYALEELRQSVRTMSSDPLAKAAHGLNIDGHALVFVESLDEYLCPLPLELFNKQYDAHISYTAPEECGKLMIGTTTVEPGGTFSFGTIHGGDTYKFSITDQDGNNIEKNVTFTSLPVVHISGSFNNNYSNGSIIVFEPDKAAPETFAMKAKWRGGITNGGDKHKRNYHVKLMDADGQKLDKKFFGLRSDNSWILESCQVDMSRIRNRILTDLWNDYAVKPYYIDQEPKAMTGTRGRFVELILNGEYRGIYCMTEAMDRKQMKLKKYDEATNDIHGQLWKSKDWSYAVFMGHNRDNDYYPGTSPMNYNGYNEAWDQYYVKYPDIEDVTPTDWSTLWDAVNFVCTASDARFKTSIGEYFDMPLVIDYYILMETILSTDNHGKNMYFAIYDKQQNKRITFGVWDMDATMGQRWSDAYYHSTLMRPEQDYATYITNNEHGDYNLFRRLRLTNANDFNMAVRLRYRDLRQTYLKTEAIIDRFRKQLAEFKTCGADQREYNRWSGDTDIDRKTLNFDTEMAFLEDWITRRMNYLDKTRFNIGALPASGVTTTTVEAGTANGIYTLDGRLVSKEVSESVILSLSAGVYIINGRKAVVGK